MNLLVAISHIVGSVLALIVLGVAGYYLGIWEAKRNQRRALENAAVELGVPVYELDNADIEPQVLQFSARRYSADLLSNRLSDLSGIIRTAWGWLGLLLEAGILAAVVWYTVTSSLANASYAWVAVAVAIAFWALSVAFSLICKLFTGRYPGEAEAARKFLVNAYRVRDLDDRLARLATMTEQTCVLLEGLEQRKDPTLKQEEMETLMGMRATCESLSSGLGKESPILERYFQNHIAMVKYVLGETSGEDSPARVLKNTLESLYSFLAVLNSNEPIAVMEKKLATGRGI